MRFIFSEEIIVLGYEVFNLLNLTHIYEMGHPPGRLEKIIDYNYFYLKIFAFLMGIRPVTVCPRPFLYRGNGKIILVDIL